MDKKYIDQGADSPSRGISSVIGDLLRLSVELLNVNRDINMTVGGQLTSPRAETKGQSEDVPPINMIETLEEILKRLAKTMDYALDNRNILQQ